MFAFECFLQVQETGKCVRLNQVSEGNGRFRQDMNWMCARNVPHLGWSERSNVAVGRQTICRSEKRRKIVLDFLEQRAKGFETTAEGGSG